MELATQIGDSVTNGLAYVGDLYTHDEPVSRKDVSEVAAALNRNVQLG
jgi:hypothetical protein